MKIDILNSGMKTHKIIAIRGKIKDVQAAVDKINSERQHYKLDYLDFEDLECNQAQAEFIAHRSHHKKAATFIQSVALNFNSK
ncbi:hypothetical protein [Photobacterium lutimaris]|uniref:Uncharacterized protein n=1 Tax=Photobacterium lutimaris TaxID=388278 RepID=A0A2T3ITT2_9GAMM|nr:hypothetical protein [Photobacterium lutimaris]PSU31758.1 hypothetical protein C9I99_21480 [Photobacterium lutimaris]TDR72591.1 hypothetical protein DFP78_11367 [Photobacterium lutimaris]